MFLQANPLCADPFEIHTEASEVVAATEVDHIMPKDKGPAADQWDNLQALCKSCHGRKTATEDGGQTFGRHLRDGG